MTHRPLLNPNQQRFVQHYTAGARGIRGNATAAYKAAGYQPRTDNAAMVSAWQLLRHPKIATAIAHAHREADAATIAQLKDWKVLAPPAQQTIIRLAHGVLPVEEADGLSDETLHGQRMLSRDDAAIGNVMLHASLAILERAYPSKLYADFTLHDPERLLAAILGVTVEALPATTVSNPYADRNGHASSHD